MSISIIVPVYNTEKYLERCLNSIIGQDFQDFELIVINDGSLDNSEEIISNYMRDEKRIRYFKNSNHGLSYTRNFGIAHATKQYILHIDSDDWIDPNFLKTVFEYATKNELDMVVTDYFKDTIVNKEYKVDLNLEDSVFIDGEEYLNRMFLDFDILPHAAYRLIKRSVYIENNITHPENISLGEDLATTPILASKCKKIGKINKAFYHYFVNESSISQSTPMLKMDDLKQCFIHLQTQISNKYIGKYELRNLTNYVYFTDYNLCSEKYSYALDYYRSVLSNNKVYLSKKDYHSLYYIIKPLTYFNNRFSIILSVIIFRLYRNTKIIIQNVLTKGKR